MVAIREVIEGGHEPYGLYHTTTLHLDDIQRRGVRALARESQLLHKLIQRLTERLSTELDAQSKKYPCRTSERDYPLELSLSEQIAMAPVHYSGVLLALDANDAKWLAFALSEPERKARALTEFARQHAPHVLEALMRSDTMETEAALNRLDHSVTDPGVLLRLVRVPDREDGFFAALSAPTLEANGLLRSHDRPVVRPEPRAVWFNGTIPFECFEVVSGSQG
jgi:hypothetical protein